MCHEAQLRDYMEADPCFEFLLVPSSPNEVYIAFFSRKLLAQNWINSFHLSILTTVSTLFTVRDCSNRSSWVRTAAAVTELNWVTLQLALLSQSVSQSVTRSVLASSPSVSLDQILTEVRQFTGLMLWIVFSDGRTGLSSLLNPLLESSSLDSLGCSLFDPLLDSWPIWSHLWSTLYWNLLHLTLSGLLFALPSTGVSTLSGVIFARPCTGIFFTYPSLESSLHDLLLESSLDPLWNFLFSTLYWSLFHLTLSGIF
jgi:hypothetical protein